MAHLYCGTSGYAYPSWKPAFYPQGLASKKFLNHYASRLNAVEINYTYHRIPSPKVLQGWVDETPERFLFCPKAHMRITHVQRLSKAEFTDVFFKSIDPLRVAHRLGPILFQLPPNLACDVGLLAQFLADLPRDLRLTFEFRHSSWFTSDVYTTLAQHGAAMCFVESEKLETPPERTADFVYFRLRKTDYSVEDRATIAENVKRFLADGRDTYVFFKHEESPEGAMSAEELLRAARP